MLNIPVEIKEKLKTNTATKNFRVTFPNGERADIINDNIVFESVRFTESVMSQDKFKLGLCESPVIEFEAFGIENIKGKKIECYYEIYCDSTVDDAVYREDLDAYVYPIPLGVFYVDSCKKEAKMNIRQVVAYGEQAYFEWKIPEGTCFYTGGGSIDISAYLALVLQTLDVVNVTSEQDIVSPIYNTHSNTLRMDVSMEDGSSGVASFDLNREPEASSGFVDFVSRNTSQTSMTFNVSELDIHFTRKDERTYYSGSAFTPVLFTFDTISKVNNDDAIRNSYLTALNQYIQEYEVTNRGKKVTHINFIANKPNAIYYTQYYAYSYANAYLLKDSKYYSTISVPLDSRYTYYFWNNDKTEYHEATYVASLNGIINSIQAQNNLGQYSQALASAIDAWETVTGHTWVNSGTIIETDWANGENDRITYGKIINFTPFGYSISNYESLTREETQTYAENILETQGKMGRFNREGNFEAFTIDADTLVPNNIDLVPSESLVPNGADVDTIYPSEYETAWYDDELSLPYGACSATHKVSGTDTYTIVYADGYDADTDPSTYQIYDISNNDLVKEMTVEEITPILTTIITNISNLRYMPSDIDMVGRPDIEAGGGIQVMSNSGAFNTYVLSRTIDGIQGLSDTITAK